MPEVKLHYTTIGEPAGQPVLVLHGTAGSARSMLTPAFAGELFGAGQPLDADEVFHHPAGRARRRKIVEAVGRTEDEIPALQLRRHGLAQYRLVTEGLGIRHLRLVIGNSMGGMHVWQWGSAYPDFMDALVPMASQPTEMSSRNWMMRRMIIDSVRNDPDWKDGNYTTQPKAFRAAAVFFAIATNGGNLALQKARAHPREGRQASERPAGGAVQRRRERLPLSVGFVARLQRGAGAREDQGGVAGDQCGGR